MTPPRRAHEAMRCSTSAGRLRGRPSITPALRRYANANRVRSRRRRALADVPAAAGLRGGDGSASRGMNGKRSNVVTLTVVGASSAFSAPCQTARSSSSARRRVRVDRSRSPAVPSRRLGALPPRLDTRLLFPAPAGGLMNLDNWRRREWSPAVEAAGMRDQRESTTCAPRRSATRSKPA